MGPDCTFQLVGLVDSDLRRMSGLVRQYADLRQWWQHWRLQIVQFGVGLPHGTFPDGLTGVETGGRALSRWAMGTGLM